MRIATYVLTALLAAGFLALAIPKLTGQRAMLDRLGHLGVSARLTRILGVLELAAIAGFLIGLVWWPLAVAAAVGVVLQMTGAVVLHLRAKDPAQVASAPVFFAFLAAAVALLHILDH